MPDKSPSYEKLARRLAAAEKELEIERNNTRLNVALRKIRPTRSIV